mmetsp:Transcript_22868/g.52372  ORF Transcript_22868/g.52372 Transcript_22868/m.52372 type:complete len:467 (-) Transcript_22868:21-1421(-)
MVWLSSEHSRSPRRCLLGFAQVNDIDAVEGRRAQTQRPGYPFTHSSAGSGAPDRRTIHIDLARDPDAKRFGWRKGRLASSSPPPPQSKTASLQAMQAFGLDADIDLTQKRRQVDRESNAMQRTKSEKRVGLPVAGIGADLSLMTARRHFEGLPDSEVDSRQGKVDLSFVSIDHQLQRRRPVSCPPPSSECHGDGEFAHRLRAEAYAQLLERPEGMGTPVTASLRQTLLLDRSPIRKLQAMSPRRLPQRESLGGIAEALPEQVVLNRKGLQCPEGGVRAKIDRKEAPGQAAVAPEFALIDALRTVTRNAPEEAAWDSMLTALEQQPWMVTDIAKTAARVLLEETARLPDDRVEAETLSKANPQSPLASPVTHRRAMKDPLDSPNGARHGSRYIQRNEPVGRTSDSSGLSATTVDSDGRGSQGFAMSSGGSSAEKVLRGLALRGPATRKSVVVAEEWKARRRAGWRAA